MIKKILLSLILTMVLLLVSCGDSSSTYTYVIDSEYDEFITMGTSADYPPFEWPAKVDGKLTIVGIDIEIAKEIAKNEGKNLKVVNKSFDFLLDDLENNKVDFVMAGMSENAERLKRVNFSSHYYNDGQAFLINKDNKDKFNDLSALDIENLRIGAQIGSIQQDLVEETFNNAQTMFVKSVAELVNNLKSNRIQALLVEIPVAKSYLKNNDDLVISDISLDTEDNGFGVAINKSDNDFLLRVNKVIEELKSSGKLDTIIKNMIDYGN